MSALSHLNKAARGDSGQQAGGLRDRPGLRSSSQAAQLLAQLGQGTNKAKEMGRVREIQVVVCRNEHLRPVPLPWNFGNFDCLIGCSYHRRWDGVETIRIQ